MASPISPGDVLDFAKGVYKLYKRFKEAPKEMGQLGKQVRLITTLIHYSDNAIMQLDFLKTPEGRNLLDVLQSHLREIQKILRQCKDVAKQWQKALKNFWRRAPFILYTMRAVPGLREDLRFELDLVETVKNQAFQIGVPAALKQLETKVAAQNKQQKSITQDEFTTIEQKRRTAYTALKRSSMTKEPVSVAEKRDHTLSTLRQSGLADDEAQILLDLHEKEVKEITAKSLTRKATIPVKSKKIEPKKKTDQNGKPSQDGSSKPKIVVIRPKHKEVKDRAEEVKPASGSRTPDKDPATTEGKPKKKQNEADKSAAKSETPKGNVKDTEGENHKLVVPETPKRRRSSSPNERKPKAQNDKTASNDKQTKEPAKGEKVNKQNNNKKAEGEKSSDAGKQTGKANGGKKASEQKPENKGEQDSNMKKKKKHNQAESMLAQSEPSEKQSKPPVKMKKAKDTAEDIKTLTDAPAAETKKVKKQGAQKETPTDQPGGAKAQIAGGSQAEPKKLETQPAPSSDPEKKTKKKKKEAKDAAKEQPSAIVA